MSSSDPIDCHRALQKAARELAHAADHSDYPVYQAAIDNLADKLRDVTALSRSEAAERMTEFDDTTADPAPMSRDEYHARRRAARPITARAAKLDIVQTYPKYDCVYGAITPNSLRINDVEVLLPEDATVEIQPLSINSYVTATITLFVSELTIRAENPEHDVPGPTGTILDGLIP